jgi:ribosomal protein S18 acetylase RimI-like enzyme
MGANNADFHGLSFEYDKIGSLHYLEAQKGGEVVGKLNWAHPSGNVTGIHVPKEHRRQGIATALYNEGTRLSATRGIPKPKITSDRTNDGEAWSRSLGIRLPKNKNL